MQKLDLRIYKGVLRDKIKRWRAELDPGIKAKLDRRITDRLIASRQYDACKTVLIYASTPIEVDTFAIIDHALASGRRVALPRCIKGTRDMAFHFIEDVSQLSPGSFGVLEPAESLPVCQPDRNSLVVVPALALDSFGYRLGYGGGYYDRYLSRCGCESIGICYSENYRFRIYHGRFDVPLKAVLTDKFIRRIPSQNGGKHGRF